MKPLIPPFPRKMTCISSYCIPLNVFILTNMFIHIIIKPIALTSQEKSASVLNLNNHMFQSCEVSSNCPVSTMQNYNVEKLLFS